MLESLNVSLPQLDNVSAGSALSRFLLVLPSARKDSTFFLEFPRAILVSHQVDRPSYHDK